MKFSVIAAALAGATAVYAHTEVGSVYINGASQGNGKGTYIRSPPTNGPIKDLASPNVACNSRNVPVPKTLEVQAGDVLTFEWFHNNPLDDIVATSHVGPVQVYVAPTESNGAGAVWVKIFSQGFTDDWATNKLIAAKGHVSIIVPDLPAGEYLFRPEVVALHEADSTFNVNPGRGVQLYMECIQFKVTSSGSTALSGGIDFKQSYTYSDPGLAFDVYNKQPQTYVAPGGPVSPIAVASQPGIGPVPAPGAKGSLPPSNPPVAVKAAPSPAPSSSLSASKSEPSATPSSTPPVSNNKAGNGPARIPPGDSNLGGAQLPASNSCVCPPASNSAPSTPIQIAPASPGNSGIIKSDPARPPSIPHSEPANPHGGDDTPGENPPAYGVPGSSEPPTKTRPDEPQKPAAASPGDGGGDDTPIENPPVCGAPPVATPLPNATPPPLKMVTLTLRPSTPTPSPPPDQGGSAQSCLADNKVSGGAGGGAAAKGAPVPKWYQCGGINYTGSTNCARGTTCVVQNPYYSQCL